MAIDDVVVAGLGEVGRPLFDLVREKHNAIGVDIEPVSTDGECAVLHICYPFGPQFIATTLKYIKDKGPGLTVINSTVSPGTTREIYRLAGTPIVYSPVRGKHFKMKQDLLHYTKFIGGIDAKSALRASSHFQSIGMKTKILASPEAAELAKLTETTYFGLQIAWAQEVERYCRHLAADYDQVVSFYEEIPFLPPRKYLPGVIGGHCVMPNIAILKRTFNSELLDAIVKSNDQKNQQELTRVTLEQNDALERSQK
jgi:UDP-N-acetyl-D-mannosaminuronate dehydrogenase